MTTRRAPLPAVGILGAVAAAYGFVQWQGRTWGSTRAERRSAMPCDDLVPRPQLCVTHAITVPGPAEKVWPWLVQVGWGRGGWYTPRWVDLLLFPANGPSADRILPDHQHLAVGDLVPDGPPEAQCSFTVVDVVPGQQLVLASTSHLPLSWRLRGLAGVEWTWSFALRPVDDGAGTRLLFRWRANTTPWWLTVLAHAVIVPADYLMSRAMLRGIRSRVPPR